MNVSTKRSDQPNGVINQGRLRRPIPQAPNQNGSGRSPNSFTLIEILVVISVIGLLFTIGMAAYNEFNRGQILSQAAKTLKNDLRLAQSKASSGEKEISVCGNGPTSKTLDGWFVSFTPSSYTLYGSCGGTSFGQKTVNLPANVSLSTTLSLLQFRPLAQGVAQGATITLSAFNKTPQVITISISGDIN